MKRTLITFLLALCPCSLGLSQPCNGITINSDASAIQVLKASSPKVKEPISRKCVITALDLTSELRSQKAISELIRYLAFHRDVPPEEAKGVFLHPYIEGSDYPAISALARIGEPARGALVQTIESTSSSEIVFQNAAHAIAISFMLEPGWDPGRSIVYLRSVENAADSKSKQQLEEAITYILSTPACKRFEAKCAQANSQAAGK